MLSDDICRQLSAYLDGELSERQRQAVERLVQASPEARELLAELQANANALRRVLRRQLPSDFALQVVDTIAKQQLQPGRRAAWRPSPRTLALAGVAASLLVAVSIGSLYFRTPAKQEFSQFAAAPQGEAELVRRQRTEESAASPRQEVAKETAAALPKDSLRPALSAAKPSSPERDLLKPMPATAPLKSSNGAEKKATEAPLAAGRAKSKRLEVVGANLPLMFPLRELTREEKKQQLRKGVEKGAGYHVELWCRGNGFALTRLRAAFLSERIGLLVDETTEARLRHGGIEANYLLYAQEMTSDQLASVLERLAGDDQEAEDKRRGSGEFDNVTVWALAGKDSQELAAVLGSDPLVPPSFGFRAARANNTPKTAPAGRSSPAGKGGATSGLGIDPPLERPPDRWALLLPYADGRLKRVTSAPVQQFLDTRKIRQKSAIQVFLVVRGASG